MFVKYGDIMMPSIALNAVRFSARHGLGVFGDDLFANVIVDPSKTEIKEKVIYFDGDVDKQGGNVRTLGKGMSYFVDQMIISSSAENSGTASQLIRKHIQFLCSIRGEPVQCDEDHIWYWFMHFALTGRAKRVGKTSAGLELYEANLRVMWRPMSANDPNYETITGITA